MSFKENLKSELSYQGILVKELASKTGISKSTLDNYLNVREYMPSADAAVKIANALDITVEYLVTGKEKVPVKSSLGPEIWDLINNYKKLSQEDRNLINAIIHYQLKRKNYR